MNRIEVALLASRGATLDRTHCRGSDAVIWGDFDLLQDAGCPIRVFARSAAAGSPVTLLPMRSNLPLISSLDYCWPFVRRNASGVLMAYNEPTVAVLAPRRTIVRYGWPTPLPRYWRQPWALERFRRAIYEFPSRFLRDDWLQKHPEMPHSSTVVVPNGVDPDVFSPPGTRPHMRRRVGFAGQWTAGKGLNTLLDAWQQIVRLVPGAELWLAGGARLADAQPSGEDAKLERDVLAADGRDGIRVVGVLPRAKMPSFWQEVDVGVVPSMFDEPFGMVALEGMACGLPMVVSADGALPEVVENAGRVVRREDPEGLAHALVCLLTNDAEREVLGRSARLRAAEFSLRSRGKRLMELVRERAEGVSN